MKSHFVSVLAMGTLIALSFTQPLQAQPADDGLWTSLPPGLAARENLPPGKGIYQLNHGALQRLLARAPAEGAVARGSGALLSLPGVDGKMVSFRVQRSPIMAPELAARYPGIETYSGQAVGDASTSVRFSRTVHGFQATIVSPGGVTFVSPATRGDVDNYAVTTIEDQPETRFQCLVDAFAPGLGGATSSLSGPIAAAGLAPAGDTLRTYRLAVAATGEYTSNFADPAAALEAIAAVVNGINAIYEVEVSVRLVLVANNDQIVYDDPDTDPFPLADKNGETQAAIDADIGDANYDIGHLFHLAGNSISGNAGCIGCVCTTGSKGSAWSQGPNPTNGNFIFLVAHEMGHQHGGRHTFNGQSCPAGAWSSSTAWEPGSGTTIMSYSSICGADNVQGSQVGDLYFHAGSRQEITAYTQAGSGSLCGVASPTGNGIPVVDAGLDYTIPRGTPFELTAAATDPDGDALTYTWEQMDLGNRDPLNAVDDGMIPLFRSFPPSMAETRTFPDFQDLLAGSPNLFPNKLGEQLPSQDRMLNFRATARDNQAGGGGADDDDVILTVVGDPFAITSPSAGGGLECNAPSDVIWNVGGGNVATNVDVLLSTDGGGSFPTVLASNTPNDGEEAVAGPASLAADARLRINALGNVFFALSDPIAVQDTLAPTVSCPTDVVVECTGDNGIERIDPQLTAFFNGASATDACDAALPPPTDDAPDLLPLGDNPVGFSTTDASGNTGSCSASVSVVDTTPPTISISLTPDQLFPAPNHKLRKIRATVDVGDTCDPNPSVVLASITSNEPDNGTGDGDTENDIQDAEIGTEDYRFSLRAERSGRGNGRIYTVTYAVTDGSGNTATASATVSVAKSASKK